MRRYVAPYFAMNTLDKLIEMLCDERSETVPELSEAQKADYFRVLCNVRPPVAASSEFLSLQDEYLTAKHLQKGVVDVANFAYVSGICLHMCDITTLKCDAIVNAANAAMLGCFHPLHNCIDNAIHSAAGVQMRLACNKIMQGKQAKNGDVIVTGGYNLSCRYVFHTVGPVVCDCVTEQTAPTLKGATSIALKKPTKCAWRTSFFVAFQRVCSATPRKKLRRLQSMR